MSQQSFRDLDLDGRARRVAAFVAKHPRRNVVELWRLTFAETLVSDAVFRSAHAYARTLGLIHRATLFGREFIAAGAAPERRG